MRINLKRARPITQPKSDMTLHDRAVEGFAWFSFYFWHAAPALLLIALWRN